MSPTRSTKSVQQSAAQRQYVRVQLPGTVRFRADSGRKQFQLHDISVGGFSFEPGTEGFKVATSYSGIMLLKVDTDDVTMPVSFEVRSIDAGNRRIGCVFQNFGPKNVATVRHIVTGYLNGDLVLNSGRLITRFPESFAPPRSSPADRLSAMLKTHPTIMFVIGALVIVLMAVALGLPVFGLAALIR